MTEMQELTLNKAESIYSKENVKLIRNSRGFNWEIRIVAEKDKLTQEDLDRLDEMNEKLTESYGEGDKKQSGEIDI